MSELMNGAESLVRTLVAGDDEVCFTKPGTSEMHFVAANRIFRSMCNRRKVDLRLMQLRGNRRMPSSLTNCSLTSEAS